jgi:hypothetical protein
VPAELAGLAPDMLIALLAQMAQDEETAEEFPGEFTGMLGMAWPGSCRGRLNLLMCLDRKCT